MEAANRLTGAARRKAWADLDADLMRNNPPWAPIVHLQRRTFVSRSFGCFVVHPVYGVDIAAACKKSRWPAGSRSRSLMLAVGLALLVAAGVAWSAGAPRRSAEGRHAAARPVRRTSTPSIRRSRTRRVVAARVRDLREAVQLPGRAGCGGDAAGPGGRRRRSRSRKDGRTYTFELKRTFRFHTGAPVTARASRTRSTGTRTRGSSRRRRRYMREIVGADAVIEGKATDDLGRPRARPLPAADPADQAGRRLHRPADDAVLLPDPAEHADRPRRDQRPARLGPVLRRRADRQPADRAEAQSRTTAAAGRRTSTRSSGRSARAARPACSPPSRTGSTTAIVGVLRHRVPAARRASTGSTGPAGSSSSARRSRPSYFAFNHDRPRVQGAGPDPAEEGDQLRDRPAGARRARSAISPAGAPTRCCRRRSAATRASTRSRAPTRRRRGNGSPGRGSSRRRSSSTRTTARTGVAQSRRSLAFNLKQIGIDLEVKYFDVSATAREGRRPAASRSTSSSTAGSPTMPTRPASSCRS